MWYLVCTDPYFSGVGACAQQSWVFVERFPPSLTLAQGASILTAIGGVWAAAFCIKGLRRFLWK